MSIQLTIPYETLIQLVDQLTPMQKQDLAHHLKEGENIKALTVEEKMALLRQAQIDAPINEVPSVRREDWYDDDGR